MGHTIQSIYRNIQAGRFSEAETACRELLHQNPQSVDALHLLGLALYHQGQSQAALSTLEQAITLMPDHAELYNSQAIVLASLERREEALKQYQHALDRNPQYVHAWYNAGRMLKELGRLEEARRYYETAITLNPDYAEAYNNLGNVLKDLKQFDAAEAAYLKALDLNPAHPEAQDNMGLFYGEQGEEEKARHHYEQAIALKPQWAEPYVHLALLLQHSGQGTIEEIHALYQRIFELTPQHPLAMADYSLMMLQEGHYEKGWALYEWRKQQAYYTDLKIPLQEWRPGEALTEQDTLLIYGEQGLGDTFQFMRYLPLVKQSGARIIFRCSSPLKALMAHVPGIDTVVMTEDLPSVYGQCTRYCFSMSLPHILSTRLETIPDVLSPESWVQPAWIAPWQAKLSKDNTFKIGLVWASREGHRTTRHRACPVEALAPLTHLSGLTLYSLQKGPQAQEIQTLQALCPEAAIVDLSPELHDFTDTIGAVSQMDLILTVDTMMAHLAGSLNQPTWVMLSSRPDWRWLLERPDSLWYPTARLFRQHTSGDWVPVIEAVGEALQEQLPQLAMPKASLHV